MAAAISSSAAIIFGDAPTLLCFIIYVFSKLMIFSDACISLYTPSFSSCAAVVCIYSTQNEPSLFYHFARYFPQKENKKAASFLKPAAHKFILFSSLYFFQVYLCFGLCFCLCFQVHIMSDSFDLFHLVFIFQLCDNSGASHHMSRSDYYKISFVFRIGKVFSYLLNHVIVS